MQSEPTEATQKTSLDSTQNTQHTTQYGYSDLEHQADSLLKHEERTAERPARPRGTNIAEIALSEATNGSPEPERRLSSTSSRSSRRTGSPVDRIIEHEEAILTPVRRKHEGPAFTVVRGKGSGSQCVNLTDFPNGNPYDLPTFCYHRLIAVQRCLRTCSLICQLLRCLRSRLCLAVSTA